MTRGVMYSPSKVSQLAKKRRVTFVILAEMTGLRYTSLASWQARTGHPDRTQLETLAEALSVHPLDLVEIESYTYPDRRSSRARNWRTRVDIDEWLGPELRLYLAQPPITPKGQQWADAVERRRATLAARYNSLGL